MDGSNPMTAAENFDLIQKTFVQAKNDYTGLALFWLIFSGINLLSAVLDYAGAFARNPWVDYLGNIIPPLLIILSFFLIFRKEGRITNRYYLGCLAIWGIPAVLLPVFGLAVRLCTGIFPIENNAAAQVLRRAADHQALLNMLLLCSCFIICAVLLNKKWLSVVGATVLLLSWSLDLLDSAGLLNFVVRTASGVIATVSVPLLFSHFCMVFGYLSAALLLRAEMKKSSTVFSGSGMKAEKS